MKETEDIGGTEKAAFSAGGGLRSSREVRPAGDKSGEGGLGAEVLGYELQRG